MIDKQLRQTIFCLHQKGESFRKISTLLKISRNTVRRALREGIEIPANKQENYLDLISILKELFARCQGNVVRIQEILKAEYNREIAYSTLTRLVRNYDLRQPPKRAGVYHFEFGLEMQHDTSPHKLKLGDKVIRAQCAALVFASCRKLYMQYYPCFTRFEAKTFLKDALIFMTGSCKRCVIDNTSVILAAGSGANAVIAPEMKTFGNMFGFEFIAHAVGHADRKSRVERPFYYIETNFLAGRTFMDWKDLNQQALDWCINVSNKKEKRILGMSPEAAFIQEKLYLVPLPKVMPPVYAHYIRTVDSYGFATLETNKYSVPERLIGKEVDVYKYPQEVHLFYRHRKIAVHPRIIGMRYRQHVIAGHHIKRSYHKEQQVVTDIERQLRALDKTLEQYIIQLKQHVRGRALRPLNRLLSFKRTYPRQAFIAAVNQALHYGLYDLNRLEELIIKYIAGKFFNLNEDD